MSTFRRAGSSGKGVENSSNSGNGQGPWERDGQGEM